MVSVLVRGDNNEVDDADEVAGGEVDEARGQSRQQRLITAERLSTLFNVFRSRRRRRTSSSSSSSSRSGCGAEGGRSRDGENGEGLSRHCRLWQGFRRPRRRRAGGGKSGSSPISSCSLSLLMGWGFRFLFGV